MKRFVEEIALERRENHPTLSAWLQRENQSVGPFIALQRENHPHPFSTRLQRKNTGQTVQSVGPLTLGSLQRTTHQPFIAWQQIENTDQAVQYRENTGQTVQSVGPSLLFTPTTPPPYVPPKLPKGGVS